uniref:Uncharacterized protein n=1 Tax=Aegilops tauschii subsp. strangulata TaxID=200361 RepID=A0A453BMG3_AEGTS
CYVCSYQVSSLLADPSFPISTSNYRKCHSLVIQHVLMVKLTFLFISKIERSGSEGSLGGINALLGCPLHLPSTKVIPLSLLSRNLKRYP